MRSTSLGLAAFFVVVPTIALAQPAPPGATGEMPQQPPATSAPATPATPATPAPPPAPATTPATPAPATTTDTPDEDAPSAGAIAEDASHMPGDDDDDHGKGKKKKTKDGVSYKPRKGITVRSGKTSVNIFMGAETVLLYGHCSGQAGTCEATDLMSVHVRRARLAFEAKLKHHLSIDFGIQVKNEVIVLKNANFSWKDHGTMIKAGFLKPPGGLERDSSTWVKPFPERSVVANFKQDRVMGVMGSKWLANKTVRIQGAIGRPPAGNFDAFEPEDVVAVPDGVEAEDLTTDPANWHMFATTNYVPSENFEVGLNATVHTSPDAGKGPNFSEPYESRILQPRFIRGTFVGGGADISWHNEHVRASAEVVVFKSGQTIPHLDPMTLQPLEPSRAERGEAGYAVLGYSPCGHYGPALDNSPLLEGYQFLLRGEFLRASPGGVANPNATAMFGSVTGGVQWQLEKQLRLQADFAVQKYNENVDPANRNVWRYYGELWGQVLL